jgi:hypothetical protein
MAVVPTKHSLKKRSGNDPWNDIFIFGILLLSESCAVLQNAAQPVATNSAELFS